MESKRYFGMDHWGFEGKIFANGTELGKYIASTAKGAFSLVGGGDSVAAVKQFGLEDKMSMFLQEELCLKCLRVKYCQE
jgi:phosphoglycerate kinase